jgi:hypothetical protein
MELVVKEGTSGLRGPGWKGLLPLGRWWVPELRASMSLLWAEASRVALPPLAPAF